jgi:hypothetical protein
MAPAYLAIGICVGCLITLAIFYRREPKPQPISDWWDRNDRELDEMEMVRKHGRRGR